jgi:hypothetical protein
MVDEWKLEEITVRTTIAANPEPRIGNPSWIQMAKWLEYQWPRMVQHVSFEDGVRALGISSSGEQKLLDGGRVRHNEQSIASVWRIDPITILCEAAMHAYPHICKTPLRDIDRIALEAIPDPLSDIDSDNEEEAH